ncbi:hypothetical protein [Kribbella sp. NPDC055071]
MNFLRIYDKATASFQVFTSDRTFNGWPGGYYYQYARINDGAYRRTGPFRWQATARLGHEWSLSTLNTPDAFGLFWRTTYGDGWPSAIIRPVAAHSFESGNLLMRWSRREIGGQSVTTVGNERWNGVHMAPDGFGPNDSRVYHMESPFLWMRPVVDTAFSKIEVMTGLTRVNAISGDGVDYYVFWRTGMSRIVDLNTNKVEALRITTSSYLRAVYFGPGYGHPVEVVNPDPRLVDSWIDPYASSW